MNNQDALNAIADIKKAIAEYGSNVKILTKTAGELDSYGNVVVEEGITSVSTKALIGSSATDKIGSRYSISTDYSLSIRLYSKIPLTKANVIKFRDDDYEIVFIDEMVLQDTTLLYELLVKK